MDDTKRFNCKKISARISPRQCAINYNRAADFIESDYFASPLRKSEKKHYSTWGIAGIKNFFHPNTMKCQGCPTGAANAEKQIKEQNCHGKQRNKRRTYKNREHAMG
jgi:hypothetical protein